MAKTPLGKVAGKTDWRMDAWDGKHGWNTLCYEIHFPLFYSRFILIYDRYQNMSLFSPFVIIKNAVFAP
jgi:hypothetical protein